MTWAPGLPQLIRDRLVSDGGWTERQGVTVLNLYRPPRPVQGDPAEAELWIDHIQTIYPDEGDHIIKWLAHRVQRPQEKINHGLVLGGVPGIGKDTLLEPVKHAVGAWNFKEASPKQVLGRFNGFLKSVVLRISEAKDMGEFDRFTFYDHMKTLLAAPPDVLRVDEKNLREHDVFNVTGPIMTTNHRTDGVYLPPTTAGTSSPGAKQGRRISTPNTGTSVGAGTKAAASATSPPIYKHSTSQISTRKPRRRRPKPSGRSSTPIGRPRTQSWTTLSTSSAIIPARASG